MTSGKVRHIAGLSLILLTLLFSCKTDVYTKEERVTRFIDLINMGQLEEAREMFRDSSLVSSSDFIPDYFPQDPTDGNPLIIQEMYNPDPSFPNKLEVKIEKSGFSGTTLYSFQMTADYLQFPEYGEHWYIESVSVPHFNGIYTIPVP